MPMARLPASAQRCQLRGRWVVEDCCAQGEIGCETALRHGTGSGEACETDEEIHLEFIKVSGPRPGQCQGFII
jgi:hypothetical protein